MRKLFQANSICQRKLATKEKQCSREWGNFSDFRPSDGSRTNLASLMSLPVQHWCVQTLANLAKKQLPRTPGHDVQTKIELCIQSQGLPSRQTSPFSSVQPATDCLPVSSVSTWKSYFQFHNHCTQNINCYFRPWIVRLGSEQINPADFSKTHSTVQCSPQFFIRSHIEFLVRNECKSKLDGFEEEHLQTRLIGI